MKIILTLIFVFVLATVAPTATQQNTFAYADYDSVLENYVDNEGFVNYLGLQKKRVGLDRFVESLGSLNREELESWGESERIAFWINAYNVLTLVVIVDHYPIKSSRLRSIVWPKNSIRQIPGAWKEVEFKVIGENMTLDHIEHGILRAEFGEARIHMALVCAARSCPPLRRESYRGDVLEMQLADQSRVFLGDAGRFSIDREKGKVRISAIFDWFRGDFVATYGVDEREGMSKKKAAVINFIAAHIDEADGYYLRTERFSVDYIDYDWTLNER